MVRGPITTEVKEASMATTRCRFLMQAAMYRARRNWGRWGDNDQVGAINLITAEKRRAAAGPVQSGRTVSLRRAFEPPQHFMTTSTLGNGGGYVMDYLGFIYHGQTITHIDALCHIWDGDGMWQGHDPDEDITTEGAHFPDITHWKEGIITKGVLIDVPRHRGAPHVTVAEPVSADELDAIVRAENVTVEPGDALLVHSGWAAYMASDPDPQPGRPRPARELRGVDPRPRRGAARPGPDGRPSAGRSRLAGPRRSLQLRRRTARQRAPRADRRSVRRRQPLVLHVPGASPERCAGHRQPRQSHRDVLTR